MIFNWHLCGCAKHYICYEIFSSTRRSQNKGAIVHTQKKGSDPSDHFLFLFSNSLIRSFVNSLFLNSGILFLSLCHDSSRGLCAVAYLRIGRSRADGAPCLTTRHSQRYRAARQQR